MTDSDVRMQVDRHQYDAGARALDVLSLVDLEAFLVGMLLMQLMIMRDDLYRRLQMSLVVLWSFWCTVLLHGCCHLLLVLL